MKFLGQQENNMFRVRLKCLFSIFVALSLAVVVLTLLLVVKPNPQGRLSYPTSNTKSLTSITRTTHSEHVNTTLPSAKDLEATTVSQRNGLLYLRTPGGCEPLDPKVLLYNRIFKTGSTTMMHLIDLTGLKMNYRLYKATTEDWYDTGKPYPYPQIIVGNAHHLLTSRARAAFAAHFYFRDNLALRESHAYINQVREPVKRVISHYFYMHTFSMRPKDRVEDMIKSGEYNETLEECFERQRKGCQNNIMTRFLCGPEPFCKTGSGEALARAVENVSRRYAVVGLLEHYDVYLKILHKRLPKFFPRYEEQKYNITKVTPTYAMKNVSNKTIESIRKANWADIQLYKHIYNLFWKQAKACGAVTI